MARLLLTVWPFPTHLSPNLAVGQALRDRGHEVAVYTDASAAPLMEAAGFRCFPFRAVNWSRVRDTVDRLLDVTGKPGELRLWREFLLDPIPAQLDDLDSLWTEYRPEALVCDMSMWGPFLIWQEERRIPAAILSHVAYSLVGGLPNRVPVGAAPGRAHWRGSLRALLTSVPARALSANFRRGANRLRRARGLAPIRISVTEFGGTLPLYLVPSAPEFDENRGVQPTSVHYVGPCIWDKPDDQHPPSWVGQLTPPVVLVEEGGLFSRGESRFLTCAASALGSLSLSSVVLLGEGREAGTVSFGSLPPHVRVQPWTPLRNLLAHASVIVSSGNSESVLTALSEGVPLIVVPSIREQTEAASRVQDTGAGLHIRQRKCTPERLRVAIETVIADPSYRLNARRIGAALARRGGAAKAAQHIEEYLL